MGASHSCGLRGSPGAALLAAVGTGDTTQAREILEQHPTAACYTTYVERNSPLLLAAGRGHHRLVQSIVEAAVMAAGAAKAKQRCINHTNQKGYSALILACMNGHAQVVESLVCNGASPLALDNSRHNTALHWAAACCRTDCVQRLLGSRATFQMQSGDVVPIADIPCFDEDNATLVKFVDRHNGWGMTALHLAVFKGSSSTVRALLRNGAALAAVTVAAPLPNCPVSQPPGSSALHLAAAAEDLPLVRLLLEAQASQGAPDLRAAVNSAGERPLDAARSVSNLLLLHLLDPSQPLSLPPPLPHAGLLLDPTDVDGLLPGGVLNVVGGWGRGPRGLSFRGPSRRGGARGDQPPHVALGSLLQRLRLVLSLEAVSVQERLAAAAGGEQQQQKGQLLQEQLADKAGGRKQQQQQQRGAAGLDAERDGVCDAGLPADQGAGSKKQQAAACRLQDSTECAALRGRLRAMQALLATINEMLAALPPSASGAAAAAVAGSGEAAAAARLQQQQQEAGGSSGSRRRGGGGSGWGSLLGGNSGGGGLSGSSTAAAAATTAGPVGSSDLAVGAAAAGGSSSGGWSSAAGVDDQAAERVLSVFITPGTLSSLAAVTKLLVNASPLSGKQQQQAAAATAAAALLPSSSPQQAAAAAGAASSSSSNLARQQQQDLQLFSEPWLPGSRGNSGSGMDRLAAGSATAPGSAAAAAAASAAAAADAGWAEQEHALVLMRSILQTAQASLIASQQAISAAASRVALRQRQEEQLSAVMRDSGRQRGPAALMGLGAGRRLLLGHEEPSRQAGRVRFGSGTATITSITRNGGRDALQRISLGSSSGAAGSSLAWAVLDVPPAAAAAAAGGAAGSGSSSRHRRHRHSHHEHRRHSRGSSSNGGSSSRRSRVFLTVTPDPVPPTAAAAAALTRRIPPSSSTSSHQPWPALLLPQHQQQQQREATLLHLPQLRATLAHRLSPAAAGSSSSSAVRGDSSALAAAPSANAAGTGLAAPAAVAAGSAGGSTAGDVSDSATSASSSSASRSSSTGRSSRSGSRASSRAVGSSPAAAEAAQTRAAQSPSSSAAAAVAVSLELGPTGGSSTDGDDAGHAALDQAAARQLQPHRHGLPHHHHPQQQEADGEGEADAAAGPSRPASKHKHLAAGAGPGSSCSSLQGPDSCKEGEVGAEEAEGEEAAAVSLCSSLDAGTCAICMDAVAGLAVSGCCHSMCLQCAYKLCCKAKTVPLCPFCRKAIGGFDSRVFV